MLLELSVFASMVAISSCLIQLEQYNVEPGSLTVSGFSSGGSMATQMHVIYSSELAGVGIFAGVVYYCIRDSFALYYDQCVSDPSEIDVSVLIAQAQEYSANGLINSTNSMSGSKVYVYNGINDTTIDPGNLPKINEFYQYFGADLKNQYLDDAVHCHPTNFYGPPCMYSGGEYINNCNFDAAFEMLNHLYGNLSPVHGNDTLGIFDEFNQAEFHDYTHLDATGYIYIPSGCADKSTPCKLHLVTHGCLQGKEYLGDSYARNTGYLDVAESNNIIVLFPQILSTSPDNNLGCWDYWGYTSSNYANNLGEQPDALIAMMKRVAIGA